MWFWQKKKNRKKKSKKDKKLLYFLKSLCAVVCRIVTFKNMLNRLKL